MLQSLPAAETPATTAPVLEVRHLSKAFAGKTVVDDVSFALHPGEAIALVGENGAGKSTTKNMLCGLLTPTKGEIRIAGTPVPPGEGARPGISAVHQELSLFGALSVAENICISDLPGRPARIDWRAAEAVAEEQLGILGIKIDPRALVETLGAGHQQVVEIAKALRHADRVLILDEPTTSLTALEREKLFAIVDMLKARGVAIIFISHFMEEIYRLCESFIVLRDGKQVGQGRLADVSRRQLEEMMVGRAMADATLDLGAHGAEEILRVEGLSSADFHDISFALRRGEILGISGLMGAGRTELAEAIFGLRPSGGAITVKGAPVPRATVAGMKARGMCYVPEDRRRNGLFLNRPVRENLSAAALKAFVKRKLGFGGERAVAEGIVETRGIAVPHVENPVGDLSGGNQQKVLIARWLAMAPDILILDEPTKGVDIGAKFDIHAAVAELARQGRGVLIVSSDLPELLHTTHRLLVMRKGRIAGSFQREDYDAVKIISLAASTGEAGEQT
ncbi:sugar ABC transporter ATP-binding protein [Pseudoruegeria sp. SHC-113]|uniref:sugar ABC transporter ATP-binding protein n=1 Tax=Pseudoruegeria sp. SHC-113 TaxID=2855439 RepID=UPI0021BABA90|nr:sugar ABC transporter ATP-binding protein [Pseudoruegeria sp. SHC-113]MCT8162152.1 sugar ABC transporter ATP-binding protein [Pseudoruegeria sp. SHC-113]